MSSIVSEKIALNGADITFEVGRMARQANGVVVRSGGAYVLGTVAVGGSAPAPLDYVPLTVHYRELMSATGRIPGSFLRREMRSSEHEVLVSRLIDRTLRPLFPEGFDRELAVVVSVFSAEKDSDLTTLALLAATASMHVSEVPHAGPVAGLVLPGELELTASVTRAGVVMAEGHGPEVSEEGVTEQLATAHELLAPVLDTIDRLRVGVAKAKLEVGSQTFDPALVLAVEAAATAPLRAALSIAAKTERRVAQREARDSVLAQLQDRWDTAAIRACVDDLSRLLLRQAALSGQRIGGRAAADIRDIDSESGLLVGSHGSARFQRGDTQALVSCTLGDKSDAQAVETLSGRRYDRFMLHYNFPSYSVGETRGGRGPGRRETGHGWLARRALTPVMPSIGEYPHTVRILSEITDSNGSSSMATVCGASLALMDAGVPVRAPVAGIAMGLIVSDTEAVVLSDITGDEDHVGDMDFKVAGTRAGITALQLDNKLGSVPSELLTRALIQAREGRLHILERMDSTLAGPRSGPSGNVSQRINMRIERAQVRQLIGPAGRTIQEIQAATGTRIEVEKSGAVSISGPDADSLEQARAQIGALFIELVEGGLYVANVHEVRDYGAIVRIGGHSGLVHVSELADDGRSVAEVAQPGQPLLVCALGVDPKGRVILSHRAASGRDPSAALNA